MEIKRTMKQMETEMSMMQGQMRQGSPTQQRYQMSMDMLEKDLRAARKGTIATYQGADSATGLRNR